MLDPGIVAKLTSGSSAGWAMVIIALGWIVKTWPVWKQRVNEARKIEVDAEAQIRDDLIGRISTLEADLTAERRRCDAELRALRDKLDGVVRQFLAFQMATAQAIPPAMRSPAIDAALDALAKHIAPSQEDPK
jgi:hypothetical protein